MIVPTCCSTWCRAWTGPSPSRGARVGSVARPTVGSSSCCAAWPTSSSSAGTARAEACGPARLDDALVERRLARGQTERPAIAVVTGRLDLDWSGPLFASGAPRPLVVTVGSADADVRRQAGAVADVLVAGDDRVDLPDALRQLRSRGAAVVLCEGGPTLNGQLLAGGLVDELCLTLSPRLIGGARDPGISGADPLDVGQTLHLDSVRHEGDFVFLRYVVPRARDAAEGMTGHDASTVRRVVLLPVLPAACDLPGAPVRRRTAWPSDWCSTSTSRPAPSGSTAAAVAPER